jgi:hypothetical protein
MKGLVMLSLCCAKNKYVIANVDGIPNVTDLLAKLHVERFHLPYWCRNSTFYSGKVLCALQMWLYVDFPP